MLKQGLQNLTARSSGNIASFGGVAISGGFAVVVASVSAD
jgi:hypothetical protein